MFGAADGLVEAICHSLDALPVDGVFEHLQKCGAVGVVRVIDGIEYDNSFGSPPNPPWPAARSVRIGCEPRGPRW